jgi:hypothetical protein
MQNEEWASENLQVIRALMERSTIYRRALAPIMCVVGATGIVAGIIGNVLKFEASRVFPIYWIAVALICLTEAFLMIRRQAVRDLEPFWTLPTRQVAQAVAPAFFAGMAVAVVFFIPDTLDQETILLLVPIWMVLYGLAMHAAGFFMPRRFRMFGWGFIWCGLAGLVGLVSLYKSTIILPRDPLGNIAMGGLFGGGHLACSLYLYFTEKRGNVA